MSRIFRGFCLFFIFLYCWIEISVYIPFLVIGCALPSRQTGWRRLERACASTIVAFSVAVIGFGILAFFGHPLPLTLLAGIYFLLTFCFCVIALRIDLGSWSSPNIAEPA